MKSWFEEVNENWWRMLSLGLTGFCGGITTSEALSSVTKPIDLEIELRKPTMKGQETAVQGSLSFLDLKMDYSDYAVLRAVIQDNVGRKVDTDAWDNVEKAYYLEEQKIAEAVESDRVEYASDARFIRYGKAGKSERGKRKSLSMTEIRDNMSPEGIESEANTLDVRFKLDGLSLKLRRDDNVEGVQDGDDLAKAFHYDVVLFRVQLVEVSYTANAAGDVSFQLSLFRLGLFDLGDQGRLVRERYYSSLPSSSPTSDKRVKRKGLRQPCPFHVLVEGYAEAEDGGDSVIRNTDNPQFVVNVDRCLASSARARGALEESELPQHSKVTLAKIVINNLSINAFIRPFEEVRAFFACEWETKLEKIQSRREEENMKPGLSRHASEQSLPSTAATKKNQGFQLQLVAHYPRIFFLADESDPHSRALVLRG